MPACLPCGRTTGSILALHQGESLRSSANQNGGISRRKPRRHNREPPATPEKPLRDDEVRRDRGTLQTRPVSFYFAVNGKCAGNVRSASSLTTRNCKIAGSDLPVSDTTAWSIPEKGRGLQRYASLVRPTEAFNTPPEYTCLHGAPKDYYSVCGDEEIESLSL